jgi:hypothetical protein
MLNLLTFNCGLAFGPYVFEAGKAFLTKENPPNLVIRQGGAGLIIQSNSVFSLRHQNRLANLSEADVAHYLATTGFRVECFDILRTSDEVVLANVGDQLLLSHPQSDLWFDKSVILDLLLVWQEREKQHRQVRVELPDWLQVSTGGNRLLLSDQRNGRWVLLSEEHLAELSRRSSEMIAAGDRTDQESRRPPTIALKGITVHLQSAQRLVRTLEEFSRSQTFEPYEEIAPTFSLKVARATEGIEVSDSNSRVALTPREAGKWVDLINADMARLNVQVTDRGSVRTVLVDNEEGQWVLQWGDEIFVPRSLMRSPDFGGTATEHRQGVSLKRAEPFLLLLSQTSGSCVALNKSEAKLMVSSAVGK